MDVGKQADEVLAAAVPAFADFFLGDVVTAAADAGTHSTQVQLGAFQSAEPDVELMAGLGCTLEESGDAAAAEGGLEAIVIFLSDGLF